MVTLRSMVDFKKAIDRTNGDGGCRIDYQHLLNPNARNGRRRIVRRRGNSVVFELDNGEHTYIELNKYTWRFRDNTASVIESGIEVIRYTVTEVTR